MSDRDHVVGMHLPPSHTLEEGTKHRTITNFLSARELNDQLTGVGFEFLKETHLGSRAEKGARELSFHYLVAAPSIWRPSKEVEESGLWFKKFKVLAKEDGGGIRISVPAGLTLPFDVTFTVKGAETSQIRQVSTIFAGRDATELILYPDVQFDVVPEPGASVVFLPGRIGLAELSGRTKSVVVGTTIERRVFSTHAQNDLLIASRQLTSGLSTTELTEERQYFKTVLHELGHNFGLLHCGVIEQAERCLNPAVAKDPTEREVRELPPEASRYRSQMSYTHSLSLDAWYTDRVPLVLGYAKEADPYLTASEFTFADWKGVQLDFAANPQAGGAYLQYTDGTDFKSFGDDIFGYDWGYAVARRKPVPDGVPPQVELVEPTPGRSFFLGEPIPVIVHATDNLDKSWQPINRVEVDFDGDGDGVFKTLDSDIEAVFRLDTNDLVQTELDGPFTPGVRSGTVRVSDYYGNETVVPFTVTILAADESTPTPKPSPTLAPVPTATAIPTQTSTAVPPTATPLNTVSPTSAATTEPTPVPPTATLTPTVTSSPTPTATATPTPTASPTATMTPTSTPSPTVAPTATASPSPSPTATSTATSAPTRTSTPTSSPTATSTPRPTFTATPTPTPTRMATATRTPTVTPASCASIGMSLQSQQCVTPRTARWKLTNTGRCRTTYSYSIVGVPTSGTITLDPGLTQVIELAATGTPSLRVTAGGSASTASSRACR